MIDVHRMWALARRWYVGRAEPEWRGRSPAEAQAILDEVGLSGAFWRVV